MKKKAFIKDVLIAFAAQIVSLVMSIIMSLIVPALLNVREYSYWQLFIFYIGYVGVFHFGVVDGLYLRLGGKKYEDLDFKLYKTELIVFSLIEVIVSSLIICVSLFLNIGIERKTIIVLSALYLILNNLAFYFGYIYQAVNLTKWYSISVIVDRLVIIILIVIALLVNVRSYLPFIIIYFVGKIISLIYCMIQGKLIFHSELCEFIYAFRDIRLNISVGISLTISNIVAMLILGVGRFIIDNKWGISAFGKISLAFSLTNFFLVFIQQISMVMFPMLRQINEERQNYYYENLRNIISVFAPVIYILYIPIQAILKLWLPNYLESLVYMAYLLPLCIFDGKMQMVYSTYFKVLRKEKLLLFVNVISFSFSMIFCLLGSYLFNDMTFVIAAMVLAVIIRSIVSDAILTRSMKLKYDYYSISEIIYTLVYILIITTLSYSYSVLLLVVLYVLYLSFNKTKIKGCKRLIIESQN